MNIVILVHPAHFSRSMPRFAKMIAQGMKERGHTVDVWQPVIRPSTLRLNGFAKKWLSYVDLYVRFPQTIRKQLKKCSPDTLFVVVDNALGPWVPLIAERPHIIHCNDFLAQRSAMGQIPENPVSWTGRQYQTYIRRGYSRGANFISISEKTRQDLHTLLDSVPACSEMVYLGLNQSFGMVSPDAARTQFGKAVGLDFENGYLLHVGGNQWYKNRTGVIAIYDALRSTDMHRQALVLIGENPTHALLEKRAASPYVNDIHFLTGINDATVRLAYSGADLFVFPSLAEGFGWPIAEAMMAGCLVVTTDEQPMTEVAGDAAFLIPRQPRQPEAITQWARLSAAVVDGVLCLPADKRSHVIKAGSANAQRFNTGNYLDKIEVIYKQILSNVP